MVSLPSTLTSARSSPLVRRQQGLAFSKKSLVPYSTISPPQALLHFSPSKPAKPLDCCCSQRSAAQYASERAFAWGSRWLSHRAGTKPTRLTFVHRYELIDPANVYGWLSGLLSDTPGTVLDLGAGSGRDAAWFAAQ